MCYHSLSRVASNNLPLCVTTASLV